MSPPLFFNDPRVSRLCIDDYIAEHLSGRASDGFYRPCDLSVLGVSYRQVQYWDRTNFIKPSYRKKGRYRLYTRNDVLQFLIAHELRKAGLSVQRMRGMMKEVRSMLPLVSDVSAINITRDKLILEAKHYADRSRGNFILVRFPDTRTPIRKKDPYASRY